MDILMISMVLLAMVHVALTKSDVKAGIARCILLCWQPKHVKTQKETDQALRFEQELLKVRLETLGLVQCLVIHICFVPTMAALPKLMEGPSQESFVQALAPVLGYALHALIQTGVVRVKNRSDFLFFEVTGVTSFILYCYGLANETDFEAFCFMEKLSNVAIMLTSVVFMDLKLTSFLCLSGAVVIIYKQWEFVGLERVSSVLIFSTAVSHTCLMCVLLFIVFAMQSHIWAKLDSDDTLSLLGAFRKILRGVCDGDVVLDRNTFKIVEDAASLEQLLKTDTKLSETNFLDLLLDKESQDKFMQFLSGEAATKENTSSIPPCLRLSLQGAEGPVSMDVFCTTCGAAGRDYYLLALKADPDQFLPPPDASPKHTVPHPEQLGPLLGRGSEVVEAFKELVQISLLVNNDTPSYDVEEVSLSFMRSREHDGMPTLRSFVRLNDWQRVEDLFQTACTNYDQEAEQAVSHRLAAPLLFRIPQSRSRSYLCAKQVELSVADDVDGLPCSFWVHLSSFHSRHVRRQKDPDLESISEE